MVKEEQVGGQWSKQDASNRWMPEQEDETLIGTVMSIDEDGKYGRVYEIKKSGTEDLILTPSHKVLQNRMVNILAGDKVRITFKGEEPPTLKGNNPTKMYEVDKWEE